MLLSELVAGVEGLEWVGSRDQDPEIESIEIDAGNSVVEFTLVTDEYLSKATQTVMLIWGGELSPERPLETRPRHTLRLNDTPQRVSFKLIASGPTALAAEDAFFDVDEEFPEQGDLIPNRNGTEGVFTVWEGQDITLQNSNLSEPLRVKQYLINQRGAIVVNLQLDVLRVAPRPGRLATVNTDAIVRAASDDFRTDGYVIEFNGSPDGMFIMLEPLELSAQWSQSSVEFGETVTATADVETTEGNTIQVAAVREATETIVASQTVEADADGTVSVEFETQAEFTGPGTYRLRVTHVASGVVETAEEPLTVVPPELAPIVGEHPPQSLTGDGLYRDIQGDGEFTLRDVQVFFDNREDRVIQGNPALFNFSGGSATEVTLADVRALYTNLVDSRR